MQRKNIKRKNNATVNNIIAIAKIYNNKLIISLSSFVLLKFNLMTLIAKTTHLAFIKNGRPIYSRWWYFSL